MKKGIRVILIVGLIVVAGLHFLDRQPVIGEEILEAFILSDLSSPLGGIYTNYLPTEEQSQLATGHEILSESIGLMMLAAYYKNDQLLFDHYSDYLDQYMLLESGVYAWRIREANLNNLPANATIDDLRIGKAYYLAYEKWGQDAYLQRSQRIAHTLMDGAVVDQVLRNYNQGDALVDLSYLDIETMTFYANFDEEWIGVKRKSLALIEDAYLGDDFPFYPKVYHADRQSYVAAEEINMIDALLVVLHLSEEGRVAPNTMTWLKSAMEEDKVYSSYRYGDWQPVNRGESTAVYAIIMRIADNMEDLDLYHLAAAKAVDFQVTNETSKLYGAFAFEETLEVFSFDQLQMLLALRRG
jgi:hypothetical protein